MMCAGMECVAVISDNNNVVRQFDFPLYKSHILDASLFSNTHADKVFSLCNSMMLCVVCLHNYIPLSTLGNENVYCAGILLVCLVARACGGCVNSCTGCCVLILDCATVNVSSLDEQVYILCD
jgi:hypothetical protein